MNEISKTVVFVASAAAALGIGWFASKPADREDLVQQELGKPFFPDFAAEKRSAIAGAEIVDFDSSSDTTHDLKVVLRDGAWQINPEKQGYPEVNADRLADVIDAVSDLKKLSVVGDDRSKHREFGVVDPGNPAELKEGTEGVGKRVEVFDDAQHALVKLVVGKADDKNAKLRYVRRPDQDMVYQTEIAADKLSSRFEDWVPPNLLDATGTDLRFAKIDDYGVDYDGEPKPPVMQGGVIFIQPPSEDAIFRSKAVLEMKPVTKTGSTTPTDEWQVADFQTFDKAAKTYKERKLAADEQIESFKLSSLGRALAAVKVVDAVKKPKLLAADLASETTFLTNPASPIRRDRESYTLMVAYGFEPALTGKSDEASIICHEGELTAGFANGVEYHLRFGDITGKGRGAASSDAGKKDDAKTGEAKTDDKSADGAAKGADTAPNRYLMVTARFNEQLVPKPKLTELPAETPAAAAPAPAKTEEKKEEKKAEEPKSPTKVEPSDDASSCDDQEPAKDETAKKDEPAKPADDKKTNEEKAEEKATGESKAEPAKPAMTPEERQRIKTDNETKQKEYDDKLKAGREKAKELNAKFAEWFYVISDSTYQDLNVDPTSLIRKETPAAAGATPPATPGAPNFNLQPMP
jgi:hypothetical protein